MNDLKLLTAIEKKLEINDDLELITFDTNMNTTYVSDHCLIFGIDSASLDIISKFDLSKDDLANKTTNKLVMCQFLTESNNISLINSKGDINLYNVLTQTVEGVGSISDGLSAAQWSPDQELLVLVTLTNALILMTKDFDIVLEQKISTDNEAESQFINVGWGSFETQFKGSQGKNAVKEKFDDKSFDWDDRKARICWRSDGEFFVVHFIDSSTNSRKFQVFNREGNLHSTIEKNINILDTSIAWNHSKSSIAASINRLNKHEIIFFEKNGLAHGSFNLPFQPGHMKVNGIYWNLDSTILCVWSEISDQNNSSTSEHQSVVQLWTVANYYWYLKQSYHFSLSNKITCVSWDPEDSYKLHLTTKKGQYINYKLGWIVNHCNKANDYNGSIAVIDSSNILVTPFKNKIIPPPMCHFKLNCQKPVNNLAWSHKNMDLIAYLVDQSFVIFRYIKINNPQNGRKYSESFKYETSNMFKLESDNKKDYNSNIQHILWTDQNELVLVVDCMNGTHLFNCELVNKDNNLALNVKNKLIINFNVFNAVFNANSNQIALQSTAGQLFRYTKQDDNWVLIDNQFKFPQPCSNYSLISSSIENKNREIFIGLSQFYRLYIDRIEVANNCSSYAIHDDFILFTDHTNNLKFIDMRKLNDSGNKKFHEEALRRVERGAKLVNAIHFDTSCILQMPRGNLEAIHPRTLVISKLKSDIDNLNYLNAVERMRKHRVNMNILFDHNPKNFLTNIKRFVEDVNDPNLINLFLTELAEEDTTFTFYKDHYPEKQQSLRKDINSNNIKSIQIKNKLNDICSSLIEVCQNLNDAKYFLVILSCYAKMKQLENALYKITQSKLTNHSAVDEGLRHLLYIVDVNELFDVALGTYDFDLVLMVAEKSQKDPKEYLPFLNDLKKMEDNYMKYKIDLYLKRYKKALQSIVKCDESRNDEIIKLVNEQRLFSEALKYYNIGHEMFIKISKLFAAHLVEKKYYEEAGLILFRANLLEDSLDLFLKSSNWQMFINVCIRSNYQSIKLVEKLNIIIEKLKSENKFLECSNIYETYLKDSENSILCLIDGHHWSEAITAIHQHNRFDFLETNLLPSLKACSYDLMKNVEQYETKFLENKARLIEVREEKAKRLELEIRDELDEDFRQNDDASVSEISTSTFDTRSNTGSTRSVASTVNSQFSNRSGRRRKSKKSMISLKKGSPYEDLALIQELSDTITYVYNMKDGISSISKALLLYNMNELCVSLQNKYENIIDLIDRNTSEIWNYSNENNESLNLSYQNQSFIEKVVTEFSKLDIKYRYPPESSNKRSWKLHFYE